MRKTARLLRNVTGAVNDRAGAGAAIFSDFALDSDDQRGAIGMAVHRHNAAGLEYQSAQPQAAALHAYFRSKVDHTDDGVGYVFGHRRRTRQGVGAGIASGTCTGKSRRRGRRQRDRGKGSQNEFGHDRFLNIEKGRATGDGEVVEGVRDPPPVT